MARVRKAVIAAAGRGTRMYPASAAVAKAMFPLVDRDGVCKPLVQIIVEEAVAAGAEEVCIVTPPGQQRLYTDYFRPMTAGEAVAFRGREGALRESERLADLGRRLRFAEQPTPEGFGHAVYQARDFAAGEPFLLLLGDHVFISRTGEPCARQAVAAFESLPGASAVTAVALTAERELHLFGTIRGRPVDEARGIHEAELIIEKPNVEQARRLLTTPGIPAGRYLSHFGIHVFGPGIFEALGEMIRRDERTGGEFQLTAAQERLRAMRGRYFTKLIDGLRLDTGIPAGFVETQMALALLGRCGAEAREALARLLPEGPAGRPPERPAERATTA